jgi:hypothetical protein
MISFQRTSKHGATTSFDPVENDSGISNMPFKQRFGPASVILVVGFIVGVGLRFFIDDAAERDLANYVRSGLSHLPHGLFRVSLR